MKKSLHFPRSPAIITFAFCNGVLLSGAYSKQLYKNRRVITMKEGIHPDYQPTTIRCACGNIIETGSTRQNITVEICSKCHPFYTGKQKLVDTSGRVDKFNRKYGL